MLNKASISSSCIWDLSSTCPHCFQPAFCISIITPFNSNITKTESPNGQCIFNLTLNSLKSTDLSPLLSRLLKILTILSVDKSSVILFKKVTTSDRLKDASINQENIINVNLGSDNTEMKLKLSF